MIPTLNPGDIVLVSPLPYFFKNPEIGDLILCEDPRDKRPIIKRLADIKNKKFFLIGDNVSRSTDSKVFGLVERNNIKAKVINIFKKNKSSRQKIDK